MLADAPTIRIEVNNRLDGDILVYDYNGAEWTDYFSVKIGDGTDPVKTRGERIIEEEIGE